MDGDKTSQKNPAQPKKEFSEILSPVEDIRPSSAICDIETTGLSYLQDRILTIGLINLSNNEKTILINKAKYDDDKSTKDEKEKELLTEFWNYCEKNNIKTLIGFSFDFDWDFLKIRSIKHRLNLIHYQKFSSYKKIGNEPIRVDLRILLTGNPYKKGTTLSAFCECFGIENNDDTSGKEMPKLYENGQIEEIKKHCSIDIDKTKELYQICKKSGLI